MRETAKTNFGSGKCFGNVLEKTNIFFQKFNEFVRRFPILFEQTLAAGEDNIIWTQQKLIKP